MATVVCVVLIQGLLVTAYPTGEDGVLMELPVTGLTEFSGKAPATGSVALFSHSPGPDLLLPCDLFPSDPVTPISHQDVSEWKDAIIFKETEEVSPPIYKRNGAADNNDEIPKKVILGAMLAESIMAVKGAEIDAKLAEIDEFVETKLGMIGPLIRNALANADASKVDSSIDSAIREMETEISSDLNILNEFVESELATTEDIVESVIRYVEEYTAKYPKYNQLGQIETSEKNSIIEKELAMLESFVESKLAKSKALVETELDKVKTFVERELGKVDSIVESELATVDSFIEKELAKTDAVVKSEVSKMESFVENELAKVGASIEHVADSNTKSSDPNHTLTNVDRTGTLEYEDAPIRTVQIDGTFPVSGRTLIFGSTGYISPFPTEAPLPLHVESFPVFETTDFEDLYEPGSMSDDVLYEYDDSSAMVMPCQQEATYSDVPVDACRVLGTTYTSVPSINGAFTPPVVGQAKSFVPLKQMVHPYNQYFTISENNDDSPGAELVLYHRKQLPRVNIMKNRLKLVHKPKAAILAGDVKFSGNVEAGGSTGITAAFPCPPLTATEEGPDGKKYIWISKKTSDKDTRPKSELANPGSSFSDISDTFAMDPNFENPAFDGSGVDVGLLGPLPVIGEAVFEGKAPAHGSVSITGHSV